MKRSLQPYCLSMTVIAILLLITPHVVAQDKPADEPAKSDAALKDDAPQELTPQELLAKTVQEGNLDTAIGALSTAAGADPNDATLPNLRMRLAARLMAADRGADAIEQVETVRMMVRQDIAKSESRSLLVATTMQLRSLYLRNEQADKVDPMIDESLSILREHVDDETPGSGLNNLATMITLKAQTQAGTDPAAAAKLLETECEAFHARMKEATDSAPLLAWVQLMQIRIPLVGRDNDEAAAALTGELEATLSEAITKEPESVEITSAWLRTRLSGISRIVREDPDTAQQMFDQTAAALDSSPIKDNPGIARMAGQLQQLTRMIAAAKIVKEMIGKPAPEFDIEAWAHGEPLPQESLKGKVVLLDFWAIWCGPCVATFPHLKEWHEQFHDKGFEIVGVTRRYGYSWDAEASKAVRGKAVDDVTLETEQDALAKFMDSHELHHPTIVTPQETEMNANFGVTGIPHAVLIDRQGNVRMVKVGSGEANASALHAMIETLIAEE